MNMVLLTPAHNSFDDPASMHPRLFLLFLFLFLSFSVFFRIITFAFFLYARR